MDVKQRRMQRLLLFLFTVSGVAGLIYETVWSYYLKLFLGHAAYAQTLVLAIFMGGMATGAWLCATYSTRWLNLFLVYAATEGILGVFGLVFHDTFETVTDFAFTSILPSLGNPLVISLFKWSLSGLLILPQSVLLGMTFPLMSGGLIRMAPSQSGSTLAFLYFTNSLGAAIGVVVSGFILIGTVGLPGNILAAALLNITLAIIIWFLAKHVTDDKSEMPAPLTPAPPVSHELLYRLLLGVSLLTGTASFIYEIAWIRMLSLVLGSSTHSFELMLSAFIVGLAFGGLWIKQRIDHIDNPVRYLGVVQVVMGLCAIATVVSYGNSFDVMVILLQALGRTEEGYILFNLFGYLLSLFLMFPATFCAGMTLPLITDALLKKQFGEQSIGSVYAANTLGAILGVFAATHVGMPFLGLKSLLIAGAALDMALGVLLLWYRREGNGVRLPVLGTAVSLASVFVTLLWIEWDPLKMASGVYRFGQLLDSRSAHVLFHEDGKTATVDLVKQNDGIVTIRTNGKVDASINVGSQGQPAMDEVTLVLLAAYPLSLYPEAKTAANIGMGSGLTSHVLLGSGTLTRVDTIEIEAKMVAGAEHFRPRVEAVFTDSRSRIHIDDAKTFFSSQNRKYDIIVAEPSNPWVSGVSSLFTEEFYRQVRPHLTERGVLVQWFHLFEMEPRLVVSVLRALAQNFADFSIYAGKDGDLIIVASNGGNVDAPSGDVFRHPQIAKELSKHGVQTTADLEVRRIGGKTLLLPLIANFGVPTNSDYFPFLDLNAVRSRFMKHSAKEIFDLATTPIPVAEMLEEASPINAQQVTANQYQIYTRAQLVGRARRIREYLLTEPSSISRTMPTGLQKDVELVRVRLLDCFQKRQTDVWFSALYNVAGSVNTYLTLQELKQFWIRLESSPCHKSMTSVQRSWLALFKAVGNRDAAGMARLAEDLLEKKVETDWNRKEYLIVAAMTGHLVQKDREKALDVWKRFAPEILNGNQQSLLLRLLLAHSLWDPQLDLPPLTGPDPNLWISVAQTGWFAKRRF
jgi:spermidine synthase